MIPEYITLAQYSRHIGKLYQTVYLAQQRGVIPFIEVLGTTMVRSDTPWPCRKAKREQIVKESVLHALQNHTERQVAHAFGVTRQYINLIKNGKR